jgi:dolichyldiphosphatase
MIYFTCCAIFTTLVAKVLKRLIKQPRPDSTTRKTTYGMPSSHSSAISFFTAYLQCVVLVSPPALPTMLLTAGSVSLFLFSLAVIWSRVQLGHHTQAQVIAGTLLGACMAVMFFLLWMHYAYWKLPSLLNQIEFLSDYIVYLDIK